MNKKLFVRVILWLCVAAIMIVVFVFSNQPADVSSETSGGVIEKIASVFIQDYNDLTIEAKTTIVSNMQHLVRKTAHFSIYCILGIFTTSAMLTYIMHYWRRIITAALICLAYASSDEFHQIFIPGRSCQISDVCLDFCGSLLGITIVSLIYYLVKKRMCKLKADTN